LNRFFQRFNSVFQVFHLDYSIISQAVFFKSDCVIMNRIFVFVCDVSLSNRLSVRYVSS